MKNNLHLLIATLFVMGAINVNSQNRCTIGDEHRSITMEVPANTIIEKVGEKIITTYSTHPVKKDARANAETHLLSIIPNGDYSLIHVYNSEYDNELFYQPFEEELEEGIYNVFVLMKDNVNQTHCYLAYEVNLTQDLAMTPTAEEATHSIIVNAKDENGQPMGSHTVIDYYPELYIMHGGDNASWGYLCGDYYTEDWPVRFNNLSDSNTISVTQRISVEGQTTYFIINQVHTGQLEGDLILNNEPSDMKTYLAKFNMHNKDNTIYNVDYFRYYISESLDWNIPLCQYGWCDGNVFDPDEPIRLITNNKVDAPTVYYDNGYTAAKPFVTAFEKLDINSETEYYDKVATTPVYYNENHWISEPFDSFPFAIFSFKGLEHFDPFTKTPAVRYIDLDELSYFANNRTPIVYWQAENYNSSTSFWGNTYIAGPMEFIGDNGCIRSGDECAIITITAGGEEIFKDSIYKFNHEYNFPIDEPCDVIMELTDNHLVDDGVVKANHTNITFDLNRDDAMPPSLTILQVMNENGNETIELPNYANSQIKFAAGDFAPHVFVFGWYDKMQYVGKPSIEVYYSIEGKDWTSLNYTEEEAMFHVNYGNFFTIDLAQLDNSVVNQWVNLKFVVTDDAGNSQTQELSNVFFAGQMTSIAEHTASPHTVYPNPFNNEVRVKASQAINGEVNISVYNMLGEQVYAKSVTCSDTSEFVIDGSNLPSGIYFYSIATETGMLQGRMVKE